MQYSTHAYIKIRKRGSSAFLGELADSNDQSGLEHLHHAPQGPVAQAEQFTLLFQRQLVRRPVLPDFSMKTRGQ